MLHNKMTEGALDSSIFQPVFTLGLILFVGYFFGRAANHFGLPHISGYIFSGLFFSPSINGVVSSQQIDTLFNFTSEITLAFIAYSIGGGLLLSRIRELKNEILWISFFEGLCAFMCTCIVVYAARGFLPPVLHNNQNMFIAVVLILGGISVATAPAATMAVIHELRAKGPLTTTLLGVVALDDALSIIIFSAAITGAGLLISGSVDNAVILRGITSIGGAIFCGSIGGLVFRKCLKLSMRPEIIFMLSISAILLLSGTSSHFGFSPLLANMVMGFVIINSLKNADYLFHQIDVIEELMYCLFFTLAAAHFDIATISSSLLLATSLLIGRFIGKLGGTFLGGKIARASPRITRHLGVTLLPQAGLSLGLIFIAKPILPDEVFDILLSAMLLSIILNEIISPPLVKWAITSAGESGTNG